MPIRHFSRSTNGSLRDAQARHETIKFHNALVTERRSEAAPIGDPSGSFTDVPRADKVAAAIRICGLLQPEERDMPVNLRKVLLAATMLCAVQPAFANVITDWDEKAIAAVTSMSGLGGTNPYLAQRMMAMVHAAMFDAVNSIERCYRPYLVQLPAAPDTSKEAAAAAAAATILASIDAKAAREMRDAIAVYLVSIPDGPAKSDGVALGEAVAAKILEARKNDGSDAPDAYRPRTTPGVYVPTAITISSMWPSMKTFA